MSWFVLFAAKAMMPTSETLPGVSEMGIRTFVKTFLSETNWLTWLGVMGASILFMISPLITIGLPLPACLLTQKALDRHATKAATHRIYLFRQMIFLVKMVAGFCWGAHPTIRARFAMSPYTGDPGTWRFQ